MPSKRHRPKRISKKIGISAVKLSKAITGNTAIDILEEVADALGVDIVELFAEEEDFITFGSDQVQLYEELLGKIAELQKEWKELSDEAGNIVSCMKELCEAGENAVKEMGVNKSL